MVHTKDHGKVLMKCGRRACRSFWPTNAEIVRLVAKFLK